MIIFNSYSTHSLTGEGYSSNHYNLTGNLCEKHVFHTHCLLNYNGYWYYYYYYYYYLFLLLRIHYFYISVLILEYHFGINLVQYPRHSNCVTTGNGNTYNFKVLTSDF